MVTEIKVYFTIRGKNFNPDELNKHFSNKYSKIWYKGEYRSKSKLKHQDNGWLISTPRRKTIYVSKEVGKLIRILQDKEDILKEMILKYNLRSELTIMLYIESSERPEVSLCNDYIKFISALNSSIEFDIIL